MTSIEAAEKVAGKVEALADLSRDELARRWAAIYGSSPPPGVRRELLAHAAAWHCQAKSLGGLSAETRRLLQRAVAKVERVAASRHDEGADSSKASATAGVGAPAPSDPPERRSLVPGARLLRDWNGRTHVVDVVAVGFLFEGRTHRSLSAIAKLITGAHWSGPRFFGL